MSAEGVTQRKPESFSDDFPWHGKYHSRLDLARTVAQASRVCISLASGGFEDEVVGIGSAGRKATRHDTSPRQNNGDVMLLETDHRVRDVRFLQRRDLLDGQASH
jgi:hypothetical protein